MEKVKKIISQNFIYIITGVFCVIYLLRSLIELPTSGKTVEEIIADSAIAFAFGTLIGSLLEMQGIRVGEQSDKVIATDKSLATAIEDINDDIDMLDDYCVEVSERALKEEQIRYLNELRIKYDDFINETYDTSKLNAYEKIILKKVKHLKVKPLKASDLTSEIEGRKNILSLGRTKKQYFKATQRNTILSKTISSLVIGYFSVKLIQDFSWADLIWSALQVMFFLLMGALQFIKSYFFVTDELRNRKIEKTNWLLKFKIWVKDKKQKKEEMENDRREKIQLPEVIK